MQKITPFLWFDNQAGEAANFYTSIFKNSKIGNITRYGKEGYEIHGKEAGTVMAVDFELEGQKFTALNGGPVWRSGIQIQRSHIVCSELREPGRNRLLLGETHWRWRAGKCVRLAQR